MVLSYGGWLILLGIMGAANLIIAKMPQARDMIAKIAPYQGWFGAVSVFYGVYELFSCITGMSLMAVHPPFGLIFWILFLANSLLQMSLGILLGVGVMKSFIKQPVAVQKMDQTITKLAPYQGVLGIIAIGIGAGLVVMDIVFMG